MTEETLAALQTVAQSAPALSPTQALNLRALLPRTTAPEMALAA